MSFILKLGKPLTDFKKETKLRFFFLIQKIHSGNHVGLEARRKSRKVYAVV